VSRVGQPLVGWTTRTGEGQDLIAWAATESGWLLAALPRRWIHTQEVALHAWWVAAGLTPDDQQLLVAAAYLHDIGYADNLAQTGFHPIDGAAHLSRTGHPDLARLVAHHGGAAVEARHRGLTRRMAAFPPLPGPVADALTYCDVTTGPRGESVDPGPRLEVIVDRHGSDSVVARSRTEAQVDIYSAVVRTLRRVAQARPTRDPYAVSTVLLGCTTLLRLQGPSPPTPRFTHSRQPSRPPSPRPNGPCTRSWPTWPWRPRCRPTPSARSPTSTPIGQPASSCSTLGARREAAAPR
jgi:hypothetical protein